MRIRVLSALHRELGHVKLSEVAADVAVLVDWDFGARQTDFGRGYIRFARG